MILAGSKLFLYTLHAIRYSLIVSLFLVGCARAPQPPVTPPVSAVYVPPPTSIGFYHTVQRGQTVYRISKTYGVDVKELMRLNHIYDPSQLEVGQKLWIPKPLPTVVSFEAAPGQGMPLEKVRERIGPKKYVYPWQTITLHHSATLQGSARLFDRDHHRRHMGGLFYHFVIGNGTHTGDGEIEVGPRWKKQVKANRPYDIQICLVGDFTRQDVSPAQFESLTHLILALQEQYGISLNHIRRHEDIPGKHTQCPGKNFPFPRLLSKLAENKRF
jgi:LysM repeat protein